MCASAQTPTSRKLNAESREVYRRNIVLLCIITKRTKNSSREESSSKTLQNRHCLFSQLQLLAPHCCHVKKTMTMTKETDAKILVKVLVRPPVQGHALELASQTATVVGNRI